jgi:hypothetical protein
MSPAIDPSKIRKTTLTTKRGKTKEVSLGEHFGDVAVKVNGVCVEIQSDGAVLVHTNGQVKVPPVAASEWPPRF